MGLSPRVRGNHAPMRGVTIRTRSIPAGAGEPGLTCSSRRWRKVYPRGCGGTVKGSGQGISAEGLSPRVRGNRRGPAPGIRIGGSIPAGAGEPETRAAMRATCTVYPRGCGGTADTLRAKHPGIGLSPRVRGNRAVPVLGPAADGSIPAGAGEPIAGCVAHAVHEVYPRGCGGTGYPVRDLLRREGLSPRVRGNPASSCGNSSSRRSIPAGAGEPRRPRGSRHPAGVYPRGCGGTVVKRALARREDGLSPRVRGNQNAPGPDPAHQRSIPAGAGEPRRPSRTARTSGVYPRGCGGTRTPPARTRPISGLSPRVRGNPGGRHGRHVHLGSIPAGAGEPWR